MDTSKRSDDKATISLIGALAVCCAVPLLLVVGVTSVLGLVVGALAAGVVAIIVAACYIGLIPRRVAGAEATSGTRDDASDS